MRKAAIAFSAALGSTILAFWLIGFPGMCGFTGQYGDALAAHAGVWSALAFVAIPTLSVGITGFWLIATAFLSPRRAGRLNAHLD